MDPSPTQATLRALDERWSWLPDWLEPIPGEAGRRVVFRRDIRLESVPKNALIRLSADTRYKLIVNGKRVCVGPTRGSESLWYYDTVDLCPFLRSGDNVILIQVLRFFPAHFVAISFGRTRLPGLTVVGHIGDIDVGMGEQWNVALDGNVKYNLPAKLDNYLHIWENISTSEALKWVKPIKYDFPLWNGKQSPWLIAPRMIPFATDEEISPSSVRSADSPVLKDRWSSFFLGNTAIQLPPGSSHRIELEYPCHSTGFLKLRAKGRGTVRIVYSESYEQLPRQPCFNAPPRKSDRTRSDGMSLCGPSDIVSFTGEDQTFEPFWWRTFRFLLIEIESEYDFELVNFETTQTNYPLPVKLSVSGDVEAEQMLEVSVRTLRNCVYDGYSDGPFYEQLQYAQDARSSILFHYYISGDDRLARQTITAFAASALPDGMLQSRYPALGTQVIPGFSLFWVLQVCDHMQYYGDAKFATYFLHTIDGVFAFFDRMIGPYGLIENLPAKYWPYVDWVKSWQPDESCEDTGVPLDGRDHYRWTYTTLLYAYVLKRAAHLRIQLGKAGDEYERRANHAIHAVQEHCFDGIFFTDSLSSCASTLSYSQHCQVMAILSGAISEPKACRYILEKSFGSATNGFGKSVRFSKCSFALQFLVFRALAKTSLYDEHFHAMWEPWRKMLRQNMTTWAEDDVEGRSDCHAWSSLPLYEYPAEVAGLTPRKAGWSVVAFAPRVRLFDKLEMTVPMGNHGVAKVGWATKGGKVTVKFTLPKKFRVFSRVGNHEVDQGEVDSLKLVG